MALKIMDSWYISITDKTSIKTLWQEKHNLINKTKVENRQDVLPSGNAVLAEGGAGSSSEPNRRMQVVMAVIAKKIIAAIIIHLVIFPTLKYNGSIIF